MFTGGQRLLIFTLGLEAKTARRDQASDIRSICLAASP